MHGTWRSLTAILGLAAGLCAGGGRIAAAAELPVADLAEIEQHLAQLNFDPGPVDGVVDDRTRTAIRLYQEFAVLPVDGEPSAKLLNELRQVSQAFVEMHGSSAAEVEAAPEPVPEPVVAAMEPQVAPPQPEVTAPETELVMPEAKVEAEPEMVAPVSPEPQVANAAAVETLPEPAPASETAMTAPAEANPPAESLPSPDAAPDSEAKAAEPSPPPTPSVDVPADGSPAPAMPAPAQSPPAAEPPAAKLEVPPEKAPAAKIAKAEPEKPEPDKAKSGKAPGFSIESMIARLKQIGDPATSARPAPAQPTAPASTGQALSDRAGYERTMIWKTQNELKRIGIDPGPADGNARERTTYAIQTYQRARGLPVDGRISEELLARLEAETAPTAPTPSVTEPLGSVAPQSAATSPAPQNGYQAFRAGYSAASAGDFNTAVKLYDQAVDSGDLSLEHLAAALYNRANALQYLGVLDKAIEDYSAAIANKPGFPAAYYNRGFAFDLKGEQIRAIEDYRKARDLGLQRLGVRSPDMPPPLR